MSKIFQPFVLVLILLSTDLYGQHISTDEIRKMATTDLPVTFDMYRQFLEIHNDGHFPDQIHNNAEWCIRTFESLGFSAKLLKSDGVEHVYAERIYSRKKTR